MKKQLRFSFGVILVLFVIGFLLVTSALVVVRDLGWSVGSSELFNGTRVSGGVITQLIEDAVGVWHLDINSSSQVDGTGKGNTGTVNGSTYIADGKIKGAYNFDGVNDSIGVGGDSSLNSNNKTVLGWIKSTDYVSAGMVISFIASDDPEHHISLVAGSFTSSLTNERFGVTRNNGGGQSRTGYINADETVLFDNEWHQIGWSSDGTEFKLYLDGESVTVTSSVGNDGDASVPNFGNANIGFLNKSGGQSYFNGSIDEVMVYGKTLTDAKILEIYNQGLADKQVDLNSTFSRIIELKTYGASNRTGLVGEWLFADGSATDTSGLGNNGTFFGGLVSCNADGIGGLYGSSCEFEGVDDYVNISGLSLLETTQCWWNKSSTNWAYYCNVSGDTFENGINVTDVSWSVFDINGGLIIGDSYDGQISNVRIYNRSLGAEEIYNNYLGKPTSNQYVHNMSCEYGTNDKVLWMHFDEDVKSVFDFSGEGNIGMRVGATFNSSCQIGGCLDFDGVNDYVNISGISSLETTQCWWNKSSTNWAYYCNVSGDTFENGINVTDVSWGVLSIDGGLIIGDGYNGSIDEVIIYPKILTPDEINASYQAGLQGLVYNDGVTNATIRFRVSNNQSIVINETGLVGRWSLDQDAASVADESGNGNNGTVTNADYTNYTWIDRGGGYYFDETAEDDRIIIDDGAGNAPLELRITGDMTVSAWIKTTDEGINQRIIGRDDGTNRDWFLMVNIAGFARMGAWSGGVGTGAIGTTTSVVDDTWHHIVGVNDEDGDLYIYVDGVLEEVDAGGGVTIDNDPEPIYIGARGDLIASNRFNGIIDEVQIYNRSLGSEEIFYLYQTTKPSDFGNWTNYQTCSLGNDISSLIGTSASTFVQYETLLSTSNVSYPAQFNFLNLNYLSFPMVAEGIAHSPNTTATIDPLATISVTANVTDLYGKFGSAILQYKNTTSDWMNSSMDNVSSGVVVSVNGSFVPSGEDNWTYRIWINNSFGDSFVSSNTTINASWDCTWNMSVEPNIDLGQFFGWNSKVNFANLTIYNTGDANYTDQCALDFIVAHDLIPSYLRINDLLGPRTFEGVLAGNVTEIELYFNYREDVWTDLANITISEVSSNDYPAHDDYLTATLVSTSGPYLYQEIVDLATSGAVAQVNSSYYTVYLSPQNLTLNSSIRNGVGNGSAVKAAYNVTLNWSFNELFNFTNSSDAHNTTTDTNLTSFEYNNITDGLDSTEKHYAALTINLSEFLELINFSTTYNFTLSSQGYNQTGSQIIHSNDVVINTDSFEINFDCYHVSDGYCVSQCDKDIVNGTFDPDCNYCGDGTCTAAEESCSTCSSDCGACAAVVVPSSGGGGGGGGASLGESTSTSEELQLVRGEQNEVIVLFENKDNNKSITDITLSVAGDIARYIQIVPERIDLLLPNSEINLTLEILSPTYIDIGTQKVVITILGKKNGKNFREVKTIVLEIHELSTTKAKELLNESVFLIEQLEAEGLGSEELSQMLQESLDGIENFDYEFVRDNHKIIEKQVVAALKTKEILGELTSLFVIAEQKGIDTSDSSRLYKLAKLSLERGEFLQAYDRVKEAQLSYALEVKGELGRILYYLENYPKQISLASLFLIIFSFGTFKTNQVRLIKNKIENLKEEEKILTQLMVLIQKETFKDKKMSMDEYRTAMGQYQKKLSKTIEQLIEFENKRVHILKFSGHNKRLNNERNELVRSIKQIQKDYLKSRKMETGVYELRIEGYNKRLTDIEESLAALEAKQAFKGRWKFWRMLKVPKGERI